MRRFLLLTLAPLTLIACLSTPARQAGGDTAGGGEDIQTPHDLGDVGATPEDAGQDTPPVGDVGGDAGAPDLATPDGACEPQSCDPASHPDIMLGPCDRLVWSATVCQCVAVPKTSADACDDGVACTVDDTCQDDGRCEGLPSDAMCDDGDPCTGEICDPGSGCASEPSSEPCDDGNPCTVGDQCAGGACQPGTPDPACVCTSADDTCEADHGDGDLCNGALHCVNSACLVDPATVPPPCEPTVGGSPCMTMACDPQSGHCAPQTVTDGAACDDGDDCSVGDSCGGGACQPGAPRDCDDGDPCTSDQCVADTGACAHHSLPIDMAEVCNGVDDDCDGLVDEEDFPGELCPSGGYCVGSTCQMVCMSDADCGTDEVCAGVGDDGGSCESTCVTSCPDGLGYQQHDGCHCRVPPTGVTQCVKETYVVDCALVTPSDDGYGQDGHFSQGDLAFQYMGADAVLDHLTGVAWSMEILADDLDYASALQACQAANATLPGDGWTIPHLHALLGMLDFSRESGSMWDQASFGQYGGWVTWSATLAGIGGGTPHMYVDFSAGEVVLTASENTHDGRCARLGDQVTVADRYVALPPQTVEDPDVGLEWDLEVVIDKVTGLAWRLDGCGSCDWNAALAYCNAMGEDGWRLPNAKELMSLVDFGVTNCPRWDPTLGTACPETEKLWSSTPKTSGLRAMVLDAWSGYLQSQKMTDVYDARCVRSLP
jgi:hypothetical protein